MSYDGPRKPLVDNSWVIPAMIIAVAVSLLLIGILSIH